MKKPLLLLALFCGLLPGVLHAGKADRLTHAASFPEGDAAWSVTFEKPDSGAEAGSPQKRSSEPSQEKIDIVRQGGLRLDTITWSSGKKTVLWWCQNPSVALVESEKDGTVNVVSSQELSALRLDASAFAWLGKETFVGIKRLKGKRCQYYETFEKTPEHPKIRAWIDAKTLQPVALSNGIGFLTFRFKPDETQEPLALPERFQKALDRFRSFYGHTQTP